PEVIAGAVAKVDAIQPYMDATVAWGMQAEAKSAEVAADAQSAVAAAADAAGARETAQQAAADAVAAAEQATAPTDEMVAELIDTDSATKTALSATIATSAGAASRTVALASQVPEFRPAVSGVPSVSI